MRSRILTLQSGEVSAQSLDNVVDRTGTVPVQLASTFTDWPGDMTDTVRHAPREQTLTDSTVAHVRARIDAGDWRSGARIPSIRSLAANLGVSRFTVVEAYDRLAAQRVIESRRGSGFFVVEPARAEAVPAFVPESNSIDVVWLLRNMLNRAEPARSPGLGMLPPDWYDDDLLAQAMRNAVRRSARELFEGAPAFGHLALREVLSHGLAALGVEVSPDQILTTTGVTHALDLIAREFTRPGDTVLVEDPGWYLMFGRFARNGLTVRGVPRRADGPDFEVLERQLREHRPRLFVINSFCHNPTGGMLSAAAAHRLLRLAETYDLLIVEDDIYGDFLSPSTSAIRLAALDQLQRVIYCGGFSKTLSPALRVGYLAAAPALCARLVEQKMLGVSSTPALPEAVLHAVLSGGRYRKHVDRLRTRLDSVRPRTIRALERSGVRFERPATQGAFLWGDLGRDAQAIAREAREAGFVCAPGALFSPEQQPSTMMRFNVCTASDPAWLRWLSARLR